MIEKIRFGTKDKDIVSIASSILLLLAIILGFIIRLLCLLKYNTFDIGPAPDQVRDAFVAMKMWEGNLPNLGPSASVGGYSLLPLYYYLVFPFTIFGADPRWQVLPNTLFSFLSIPLFIYLIYQLLERLESKYRLLWSSLAGFWYSLIFPEIFINTFLWNPGPIPFFLFAFILIYRFQSCAGSPKNLKQQIISWTLYGVVLAILMSLHSTTMFVMPIIFVATVILFIVKHKNYRYRFLLPAISLGAFFIVLLPYWKGELSRGFNNSKQIISTVIGANKTANVDGGNIFDRLGNLFWNYFDLGQQAYFLNRSSAIFWLSLIFLATILILSAIKFKGDRTIAFILTLTWTVYLYAASNFKGTFFIHYKFLFFFAPIIFAIVALAYLDYSQNLSKIIGCLLAISILGSCLANLGADYRYILSKYGTERLMSTTDYISVLNSIPDRSTICEPSYKRLRETINPYTYLDQYITKKNVKITNTCQSGNYRVYPQYQLKQAIDKYWPAFDIVENPDWSSASKQPNITNPNKHFLIQLLADRA